MKIMNITRSLNCIIGKGTVAAIHIILVYACEEKWLLLVCPRASFFKTLITQHSTPTLSNGRVPA